MPDLSDPRYTVIVGYFFMLLYNDAVIDLTIDGVIHT